MHQPNLRQWHFSGGVNLATLADRYLQFIFYIALYICQTQSITIDYIMDVDYQRARSESAINKKKLPEGSA